MENASPPAPSVERRNALGQPIGAPVPNWTPRPRPPRTPILGRACRVEPLDPDRQGAQLYAANSDDLEGRMWTYLSVGPFDDEATYHAWLTQAAVRDDPLFFAVVESRSNQAVGLASYLRIDAANGVIEVGNLQFSPRLQRTVAATEAMYLMMRRAFDELGYRRYEWKCDHFNAASRAAAERYGFHLEGLFRQAVVYKGRNRDTAWYSIADGEWPAVRDAFERWLDPANFDANGRQRSRLAELREQARRRGGRELRDSPGSSPALSPGAHIQVRKLRHDGSERVTYRGEVVRSDGAGLVLRAEFSFPEVSIGCATFCQGDVFVEFYEWGRWFVVAQVSAPDGTFKGWYCDVTMPPTLDVRPNGEAVLTYVDLALDLWRDTDGSITLLDEDEFASYRAAGVFTTEQVAGAEQGWAQLRALAEADSLPRRPA